MLPLLHYALNSGGMLLRVPEIEARPAPRGGGSGGHKLPLHEIAMRTLPAHFAPVGALVNGRGDILYLMGRTGRYLEPAPGEASMNIFRIAREGLRGGLTIALHRAVLMARLSAISDCV